MAPFSIQQAFETALQHRQAARLDEAEQIYREILALPANQPGRTPAALSQAACGLGYVLKSLGRLDEAIVAFRRATGLLETAEAYAALAGALKEKKQTDAAISAYRSAVALQPDFAEAHVNLGAMLMETGQVEPAMAAYRAALALNPNFAEAWVNLGTGLREQAQFDQAVEAYRKAIELKADLPEAHSSLGMVLLAQGNFQEGWEQYEWRWKSQEYAERRWTLPQPMWDGSDLNGRVIALRPEQGFGDTIQFIRYAPLVAQRGGRVLFGCEDELRTLLKDVPGIWHWASPSEPLPEFHVYCPLLSLPRLFGTNLNSTPANVPYLFADPTRAAVWANRLSQHAPAVNVGLVWAGGRFHKNDRNRSMTLAALMPLLRVPRVRFVSLQKGDPAAQAKSVPKGIDFVDWTRELNDFSDTAALIANLDLVITVDTSVAHVAGAMGKPVWVMLPVVADFRWMIDRQDSPWYPTMHLFRQRKIGDWAEVVARLATALTQCISSG
jgi:tetratricopeptide (TPR) repeat protein